MVIELVFKHPLNGDGDADVVIRDFLEGASGPQSLPLGSGRLGLLGRKAAILGLLPAYWFGRQVVSMCSYGVA